MALALHACCLQRAAVRWMLEREAGQAHVAQPPPAPQAAPLVAAAAGAGAAGAAGAAGPAGAAGTAGMAGAAGTAGAAGALGAAGAAGVQLELGALQLSAEELALATQVRHAAGIPSFSALWHPALSPEPHLPPKIGLP